MTMWPEIRIKDDVVWFGDAPTDFIKLDSPVIESARFNGWWLFLTGTRRVYLIRDDGQTAQWGSPFRLERVYQLERFAAPDFP